MASKHNVSKALRRPRRGDQTSRLPHVHNLCDRAMHYAPQEKKMDRRLHLRNPFFAIFIFIFHFYFYFIFIFNCTV